MIYCASFKYNSKIYYLLTLFIHQKSIQQSFLCLMLHDQGKQKKQTNKKVGFRVSFYVFQEHCIILVLEKCNCSFYYDMHFQTVQEKQSIVFQSKWSWRVQFLCLEHFHTEKS